MARHAARDKAVSGCGGGGVALPCRTWKQRETCHCFGVFGETVLMQRQRLEAHRFSKASSEDGDFEDNFKT